MVSFHVTERSRGGQEGRERGERADGPLQRDPADIARECGPLRHGADTLGGICFPTASSRWGGMRARHRGRRSERRQTHVALHLGEGIEISDIASANGTFVKDAVGSPPTQPLVLEQPFVIGDSALSCAPPACRDRAPADRHLGEVRERPGWGDAGGRRSKMLVLAYGPSVNGCRQAASRS